MEKTSFQNVIIGFGKGGKTLAKFLAEQGESVVIIEESKRMYGGTCINIGCIPSKSLIVNGEKGMEFEEAAIEKTALIAKLNSKNYHLVADEASAQVLDGKAVFISNHEIGISDDKGEPLLIITGERIFINTGAEAIIPDIPGISENPNVITSTELLDLTKKPEKLVIIGAGPIGLEFAAMFSSYQSKVTVIDLADRFLPREDEDVSFQVRSDLEAAGISFKLVAEIQSISDKFVHLEIKGKNEVIEFDKLLIAAGRKANTGSLGLENTSVKVNARGEIVVNDKLETNAENIWAIGDVHGGPQFTYMSLDDFRIIQNQLYGDKTRTVSDRGPLITNLFIRPSLANVGLNERRAVEERIPYRLFKLEATDIVKAAVLSNQKGLMKALVNPKNDEILGATFYVEEAHELINLISLAMKAGLPYTMLRDHIYTHPTMTEALNDLFAAGHEVK